jgi:hypothetical protein
LSRPGKQIPIPAVLKRKNTRRQRSIAVPQETIFEDEVASEPECYNKADARRLVTLVCAEYSSTAPALYFIAQSSNRFRSSNGITRHLSKPPSENWRIIYAKRFNPHRSSNWTHSDPDDTPILMPPRQHPTPVASRHRQRRRSTLMIMRGMYRQMIRVSDRKFSQVLDC